MDTFFRNNITWLFLLILGTIFISLIYAETPDLTPIKQYVSDYANILTPEQEQNITLILEKLKTRDKGEIAVVTINTLDNADIKDYAFKLANNVLGNKEKNNGLLLLIVIKDRKYRFEVGRGLEPYLPDLQVKIIGDDYLIPRFKEGNYYQGIYDSIIAVNNKLVDEDQQIPLEERSPTNVPPILLIGIIIVFFGFFILIFILGIRQAYKQGKSQGITSKRNRSSNDLFEAAMWAAILTRGGRGGFGGSGGFGGFGGGSFGGGGAGGNW